ncbi:MAG: anti-sigma factor [Myxococcota bacterium]
MNDPDRLEALLADAALGLLDADERAELETLLAGREIEDLSESEWVVADLMAREFETQEQPLPDDLRTALLDDARAFARTRGPGTDAPVPASPQRARRRAQIWAGAGWVAAAALLVLLLRGVGTAPGDATGEAVSPSAPGDATGEAVSPTAAGDATGEAVSPTAPVVEPVPSTREIRAALLADAGDAVRLAWQSTDDPTAAGGVVGDVVWSDARQAGVLRFQGLAANDRDAFQYQLWIFDAARDERFPVDGGIFDVPANADGADVLVPIDPRLPVARATLFAVTVERPGGTVVSTRDRIAVLAPRP